MTNTKTLFLLMPLLMLACTLTAQVTPRNERSAVLTHEQIRPTQAPTNPPQACQVKTGIDAGRLNVRVCGGPECSILTVIHEGDNLTITQTDKRWLAVKTANGLSGWVHSDYCEVKK